MNKPVPKPKLNPAGLPVGCGSIAKRGNVYWIYYADASGQTRRESADTSEYGEARRRLAQRAAEALEAQLAVVRGALDEKPQTKRRANHGHAEARDDPGHGRGRRSVRDHSQKRGDGRKANRGGKA